MSFQALLFCQDEKTTRTVTQVLTELEFEVEACSETFTAVKKLTSQAFEAVVVDCQNEESAGLLLKTARNSASNQAALMVAVVEGQAGVAAAFRIGANLVLTKPIAIEQARGTLRVARGLLRKSAAPAAASSNASPVTKASAAAQPPAASASPAAGSSPARIAVPSLPVVARQFPTPPPVIPVRSIPPMPQAAVLRPAASAAPVPFGKLELEKERQPTPDAASAGLMEALDYSSKAESTELVPFANIAAVAPSPQPVKPVGLPARSASGMFAAATAPAKDVRKPLENASELTTPFETVVADKVMPAKLEAAAAPVETASEEEIVLTAPVERSSNTPLIVVAVLLVLAALAYLGWSQFKGHASTSAPAVTPVSQSQNFPPTFDGPTAAASQTPRAPKDTIPAPTPQAAPEESANRFAHAAAIVAPDRVSAPAHALTPAPKAPLQIKTQLQRIITAARQDVGAEAPSLAGMAGTSPQTLSAISLPVTKALPTVAAEAHPISQGLSDGLLIKKVQPNYPAQALQMHIEGTVELLATIGRDGSIRSVKALSGPPILVRAASDAVRQWKYRPYTLNGQPVEIDTQISIKFVTPR